MPRCWLCLLLPPPATMASGWVSGTWGRAEHTVAKHPLRDAGGVRGASRGGGRPGWALLGLGEPRPGGRDSRVQALDFSRGTAAKGGASTHLPGPRVCGPVLSLWSWGRRHWGRRKLGGAGMEGEGCPVASHRAVSCCLCGCYGNLVLLRLGAPALRLLRGNPLPLLVPSPASLGAGVAGRRGIPLAAWSLSTESCLVGLQSSVRTIQWAGPGL